MDRPAPLIVHIVFRFDYGGLENGVVNVVNALHGRAQRHHIIALTEVTSFQERLRDGIDVSALGKQPGRDFGAYRRLYRLLRKLRPTIVHTRNVGTLDCALVAFAAGVPARIHGEHGWDVADPDGTRAKYRWFRRAFNPFVQQFVTVSQHLADWLVGTVKIRRSKIRHICNGVDVARFTPERVIDIGDAPAWLTDADSVVIGSVCRFSPIKDPLNLVNAFIALMNSGEKHVDRCRLVMIGDGPLHAEAVDCVRAAGFSDRVWLPGSRDDVAAILRGFDVFVLGSQREGISNTILEAMACALPIIATATGGNVELVDPSRNGTLVPPGDSQALTGAIQRYVADETLRSKHGQGSRTMATSEFSLATMIGNYRELYAHALAGN
ncbi:MAG: TIGR03088 family PEP-CTERM/XrtA system glycosyltransferase [Pseudomonadota bacterium]